MRVIVCGAGQVGYNIARYLASEDNEVTVVDQRAELVNRIGDSLDVQAVVGHASHPDVLEQAGARDAEMIIAVTYADEVNMVACQVAHSLFGTPTRIARVRNQSYLDPQWGDLFSRDHMPIDMIISPEVAVAEAVLRRLRIPGTINVIPLAEGRVQLIGVRCDPYCPLVNTPLRQISVLFPDLHIVIVGIVRNDRAIIPSADDQMLTGDEVYFVVDSAHVHRAMLAFGHEEPDVRRVVIIGGGNIGLYVAQSLESDDFRGISAKVIEADREQAEQAARALSRTVVLHGDGLDPEVLQEASVETAEAVIALTNDDETNVLASLLAKKYGSQRAMTLINKTTYNSLVGTLGVDVTINPRAITVSKILQRVRRGKVHAVHTLHEGFGELIEADALETSPLVGRPLKNVKLPQGVLVGAIVRGKEVITPRGNTVVQANDRVILFAGSDVVKKVERLFSVRLEFF